METTFLKPDEIEKLPAYHQLAVKFMKEIMYDNGMVNRLEPERYEVKYINHIAIPAGTFFQANPDLPIDETINEIATMEYVEMMNKYSYLNGFESLNEALEDFFNDHLND